ncbi:MAG: hypothetical protein M0T82_01615 [Desulfobacteraceae bacterium]|nr:hypothetical protein [Desulfobacteraceae bacterium]
MKKKTTRVIAVLLTVTAISGLGYLGYLKIKADRQILALGETIEAGEKRYQALQKKNAEEKAGLNACTRARQADEARKRDLQEEIALLLSEKEEFDAQAETLEKKHQAALAGLEEKIKESDSRAAKTEKSLQDLAEKFKALQTADREKSGRISGLESDKRDLESRLRQTEQSLDRSLKHNKRLGEIAEELTEKYKKKAGSGSEPFTKLGMVELEHLIQEYVKQIDKETIIQK